MDSEVATKCFRCQHRHRASRTRPIWKKNASAISTRVTRWSCPHPAHVGMDFFAFKTHKPRFHVRLICAARTPTTVSCYHSDRAGHGCGQGDSHRGCGVGVDATDWNVAAVFVCLVVVLVVVLVLVEADAGAAAFEAQGEPGPAKGKEQR